MHGRCIGSDVFARHYVCPARWVGNTTEMYWQVVNAWEMHWRRCICKVLCMSCEMGWKCKGDTLSVRYMQCIMHVLTNGLEIHGGCIVWDVHTIMYYACAARWVGNAWGMYWVCCQCITHVLSNGVEIHVGCITCDGHTILHYACVVWWVWNACGMDCAHRVYAMHHACVGKCSEMHCVNAYEMQWNALCECAWNTVRCIVWMRVKCSEMHCVNAREMHWDTLCVCVCIASCMSEVLPMEEELVAEAAADVDLCFRDRLFALFDCFGFVVFAI